jgi:hypothetical protein
VFAFSDPIFDNYLVPEQTDWLSSFFSENEEQKDPVNPVNPV